MRKKLLTVFFIAGGILFTIITNAQSDHFAYAITDVQKEGANWSFLRKLNLQTGEYSNVIMNGDDVSLLAYDAASKKQFASPLKDAVFGNTINAAFATGVAAMAFDKKNNRLYYTPMFIDQLRYLDLKTMKVYYVTDRPFTGMSQKSSDQGNVITRMAIGSDGNGYATTNDGTHLMRFSTGKKLIIDDLGTLVDDPANKTISIHNSCSSFGGDMIADDDGNLYAFSARNNVFKINIESRIATYLGAVSGLPANFTINGAAVNENNTITVSSAQADSYFIINPKTWAATPYKIAGAVWRSSDLANSNLLVSGNKHKGIASELLPQTYSQNNDETRIMIYPNPVTNNKFTIQFSQLKAGNYTIQLTDVAGRQVMQRAVNISGDNQTQNINLNPLYTRGIYLLKVTGYNLKSDFSTKLVVQ